MDNNPSLTDNNHIVNNLDQANSLMDNNHMVNNLDQANLTLNQDRLFNLEAINHFRASSHLCNLGNPATDNLILSNLDLLNRNQDILHNSIHHNNGRINHNNLNHIIRAVMVNLATLLNHFRAITIMFNLALVVSVAVCPLWLEVQEER